MTRMFTINEKPMRTWNVFVGCGFDCTYCHARTLALTRLRALERYVTGFSPHLVQNELRRHFHPGEFIFIAYMGDIAWCARGDLELIMDRVARHPVTTFLMMTKDPLHYLLWQRMWGVEYPANLVLGTTIESNFDHKVSQAPAPEWRYRSMATLTHPRKFISIEPLMDFHTGTLVSWIKEIRPEIIEIGPDNYHNNLPEPVDSAGRPCGWKVRTLLEALRAICPTVVEKPGLSRLADKL